MNDRKDKNGANKILSFIRRAGCAGGLIFLLAAGAAAQRIAVLVPESDRQSLSAAAKIEGALAGRFNISDAAMVDTAFRSIELDNYFNLSHDQAKLIGAVVGCDYFLLVKSATQRRASLHKPDYFEAFAVIYAVGARSGRLVAWRLLSREAATETEAKRQLSSALPDLAGEIAGLIDEHTKAGEAFAPPVAELPAADASGAPNFRPPLPFRRIKPAYTATANFYGIAATVDILVDVGEKGDILRTEIVRWAGYGLDEAVADTVRRMQWRPAERDGKFLPMRVLLRYNFKKIEKDE